MSMETIEALAKQFAGARTELGEKVQALRDEQEAARRRRITGIKNALGRFRETHEALLEAIKHGPELFEQPKTRTLHGVRVGYMKQRGKVLFEHAERVIELIERKLADRAAELIATKKSVDRAALSRLSGAELKAIGVTITADVDAPFIKAVDDELDKLLKALLADDELEEVVA